MVKEKRDFILSLIESGRIMVDVWNGNAHIMKKDRSGFMKWNNNGGYLKTVVGGWCIAVHEIIAVASGLDVVDKHERLYINHINGDKSDCRFENLEVLNNSKNNSHAWKLGLKKAPQRRLTKYEVLLIKYLLDEGWSQTEIAEAMDVSVTHINSISTGHRWSSVQLDDYIAYTDHIVGDTLKDYIDQCVVFRKVGESIEDYFD